jgi:hypothetical protein
MNNSISAWANRAVRRADKKERKKAKRKLMVTLLGKQKTDVRTEQNLEHLFGFILGRHRFTVPEVLKNIKIQSSVAYDLIETLVKKNHRKSW